MFRSIFIFFLAIYTSGCGLTGRVLFKNVPDVCDHEYFPTCSLQPSTKPFHFSQIENIELPHQSEWALSKKDFDDFSVEEFLQKNKSTSLLILRNDTVIYENYFNGYRADSISQVFSVSKAYAASLVAIAIEDGLFRSFHQPVYEILPGFDTPKKRDITIGHLVQMTSGLAYNDYKTYLKVLRMYYNKDLHNFVACCKTKHPAGTHFAYKSISTLILGMCIEKVSGQSYSQYLQEELWGPLGMCHNACINLDLDSSAAHAFGGISTVARDLAKFGRLYLRNGDWEGKQLIPEKWVLAGRVRDTTQGSWWGYNRAFWLDTYTAQNSWYKHSYFPEAEPEDWKRNDYLAGGFKGQYVYINPELNIVIVRQGLAPGKVWWSKSWARLADLLGKPTVHKKKGDDSGKL